MLCRVATCGDRNSKIQFYSLAGLDHRQPSLFAILTLTRQNHLLNLNELREANKKLASAQ